MIVTDEQDKKYSLFQVVIKTSRMHSVKGTKETLEKYNEALEAWRNSHAKQ